jgi:hypothetical protein
MRTAKDQSISSLLILRSPQLADDSKLQTENQTSSVSLQPRPRVDGASCYYHPRPIPNTRAQEMCGADTAYPKSDSLSRWMRRYFAPAFASASATFGWFSRLAYIKAV